MGSCSGDTQRVARSVAHPFAKRYPIDVSPRTVARPWDDDRAEAPLGFLKGRMNRATYWLGLAVGLAVFALLRIFMKDASINEVVLLILAIPRLHDTGRSGWW